MDYNYNSFFLFLSCLFSFCLCEITEVKKSKLLSDFINYYNFRPNVNYKASDGFLQSISEIDDTTYQIEVSFRAQQNDVTKMMKCQAGIEDLDEKGIAIVNNVIDCTELEQQAARDADASLEAVDVQAERIPVVLENEDEVDPETQEVQDLVHMGIRHLDIHDPSAKHSLNSIIDVKRQVQVVNGVRYILALSINFNNCTEGINDFCTFTKTCRISILVKPWQSSPSGAKYRAILANTCIEKWQFGDDGEDLSESTDSNNHSQISNRKSDTLSQPVKQINKEYIPKIESTPQFSGNSILGSQSTKATKGSLSQDKKKTIDEMLDFLKISGYKPQVHSQTEDSVKRSKRSYDYDLQVLSLTQDYRDLKKSIENAKFIYEMAQVMVDYLNIIDIEVKNRAVQNVIKAEEEEDDEKHFVYIQVQVVIPCDAPNCESKDAQTKICNGVVDSTYKEKPQVLYSFCYNDNKEMAVLDKFKDVESDDPVLLRLTKEVLKKIEFESTEPHAMKIKEITSANTRLASTRLTKISMIVEYINCNKSVPFILRKKCLLMEHLGSLICEVLVHERQWLKEKAITYTCTERPIDFIITKDKQHENLTMDDPIIAEVMQDALQYLEIQSSKKFKQKIIKVSNISTQIVAGFLIKIDFVVGYTNCTDTDMKGQLSNCVLLKNERLRRCKAQVWDRSWIVDGRQMEVSCEDDLKVKEIPPKTREKRDVAFDKDIYQETLYKSLVEEGGEIERNSTNPIYLQLAQESLKKYLLETGNQQSLLVVRIDKVTTQVVSGTMTRINFIAALTRNSTDHVYECFSKIWEQPWLNKTEIDISCVNTNQRSKRQILGGETEQNPNDPVYIQLAQESLRKYLLETENQQTYSVGRIKEVTTQVVAGSMTRILFTAAPKRNYNDHVLECFSEIWERPWLNKKDIDVSCMEANQRSKRQILGGETEQNPNNLVYIQLAQESLKKYLLETKNQQPLLVVRIDKVTTQVVSGTMTRINFIAALTRNSTDHVYECFSKIWEQPWLNKTEIDVSCVNTNQRSKRQILGGEAEQNPNDPLYNQLAMESLQKYLIETGIQQTYSVGRIKEVTTQVVAGSMTRIYFTAVPNANYVGPVLECFSKIWELNKKEINVSCVDVNRRSNIQGGEVEQNPNDPLYNHLAMESLQKYLIETGIQQTYSVGRIKEVTTQVVAGSMTRIHFTAVPNANYVGPVLECFSKIRELNRKEIDVSCVDANHRSDIVGGLTEQNPNDPLYIHLATESLQKYLAESGNQQSYSVGRIKEVTTQVVAGSMTRILFTAAPKRNYNDHVLECFSEIWERPWLNKKEINVSCVHANRRSNILGGEVKQNPNDPLYHQLAKESLQKYLVEARNQQSYSVGRIKEVTIQVVAGSMTRIHFTAVPNANYVSPVLECFSKIRELNRKEIDVSCLDANHRSDIVGGLTEQNPNDPLYNQLAMESLQKYLIETGIQQTYSVGRIKEVTTQVVAGSMTRIYFTAVPNANYVGPVLECFSKIWEFNKKEINVSCVDVNRRSNKLGGEVEQNPNDPLYKNLATESLQKYLIETGIQQTYSVGRIKEVTTQVVAGAMTRIFFTAVPKRNYNDQVLECFSEIWERPWLNNKDIDVSCIDANQRSKRQILGGEMEQNPNDPVYIQLAQESLQKYLSETGNQQPLLVVRIDKVTTQVVSGTMTRINFVAALTINSMDHVYECFSKIWEQPWLNKTKIDVSCVNTNQRSKRQILGGETERNPNDPVYIQLAQESLQKYLVETGNQHSYSVGQMKEVTTQVVAGSMIRIYFTAVPNANYVGPVLECFSKIWEFNKKEINVSCVDVNRRSNIQGGEVEQNPNDPLYNQLAMESLQKYLIETGIQQTYSVGRIKEVTTKVVAGSMSRIHFTAVPNANYVGPVLECFSEIRELNRKEIDVSCVDANHKSDIVGGLTEQNPNDPLYIHLAKESLQKYLAGSGNQQSYSVGQMKEVTTQIVAGLMTRIYFTAVPNANYVGPVLECFSKIWEFNKKEINVSCVDVNRRSNKLGGEVEQNPNDPLYKNLATESLQKYLIETGIQQTYSVGRIKEVTTQVVAGSMTRMHFTAVPNANYVSPVLECFSKIRELNRKEIDVSCVDANHRSDIIGGLTEQNPNDPLYNQLAMESLQKYIIETGIQQTYSVGRIKEVTTQVVTGSMTRIYFTAVPNANYVGPVLECFSKIWEFNKKEINVSCVDVNRRSNKLGGEVEQNPNDPLYKNLATESLQKYLIETGIQQTYSVGRIKEVTTQVVAGAMTRIFFTAVPKRNYNDHVLECFSEIWERPWLNNKDIDVSCMDANQRSKRQILGGETEQNPNDPVYIQLAQESLKKYLSETGNQQPLLVVRIDKVTTQVVSGTMTRINFLAALTINSMDHVYECFSKIWEQPWLNKTKIDVSCVNTNQRSKRQILGGETEPNPNDPVYIQLAQESLQKYLVVTGNQHSYSVGQMKEVTTQVVAGSMTRIYFTAVPNANYVGPVLECFSKIWEFNKKEINVSCVDVNRRSNKLGGEVEQNPNDPLYKNLATESLQKYLIETGIQQTNSVGRIKEVTTQVVAGAMTRIFFTAVPKRNYNDQVLECFSEIWERPWLNNKDIDVSCIDANQRSKRQILGGEMEQNPNDPVYIQLAQESLQKYLSETGNQQPLLVVRIDKVTTQVVSGTMTRINFVAALTINSMDHVYECFSKIWEQPWLNKTKIDVSCVNTNQRSKRQILGGETERNPNDPVYIQLAQESLQKYLVETGNQHSYSVGQMKEVTTQVVAGSMIRIYFTAVPNANYVGPVLECFSKIWEFNKKEINVSCVDVNRRSNIQGGEVEQNPNDPLYNQLAMESLQKYLIETGIQQTYSVGRIKEVTTKVVAGSMSRIHFTAVPNANYVGPVLECFSEIRELNRKEIDVSCVDANHKSDIVGGLTEQNPNDPLYIHLAKESLQKYLAGSGNQQSYSVGQMKEVTTQIVAGLMTRIYFTAVPNANYVGPVLECFSKIWEFNKKEINVSCVDVNRRSNKLGGEVEQNPNDPLYKNLATESLQKYLIETGIQQTYSVGRIKEVTTQVVAGSMTRMHFTAVPNANYVSPVLECFSKIRELNRKEIDVSCVDANHRSDIIGGLTEQNPNDPLYNQLAMESLQKYIIETGIQQTYSVGRIKEVTTQVVTGSMTRIYFTAVPNANYVGPVLECFSKIWEFNKKEINVSCVDVNRRSNKLGGEVEQNPNDPLYKNLATESLQKYLIETGIQQTYSVGRIKEVTTQVVAGAMTRIFFTAVPKRNYNDHVLECFSEIWERPWLNNKDIDVSCMDANQRSKRQILGGETEQNPNDPVYIQLAQESLKKYLSETGNQQPLLVVRIDKVTTQVVSGTMTRINFLAALTINSMDHVYECFSKIWEQPWLNKTKIDVSCVNTNQRSKRQILGGETEPNPNDPVYIQLAQESLQKYLVVTGNQHSYSVGQMKEVTTQVVAGSMTRIYFTAVPNANYVGPVLECFSKIWEFNKKEINVSCVDVNRRSNKLGGEVEQNPNDPLYKNLATESLQKYLIETGIQQTNSVGRIKEVTTQVVAGAMTRIFFTAVPKRNYNDHVLECFSEIWERPWLNNKDIDVSCIDANQRFKRQILGGETEQNPNDPVYIQLAQESLKKYLSETGNQQPLLVVRIDKVTTQVVSGTMTRINFLAALTINSMDHVYECFSKIWEQPWLNKTKIDVSCVNTNQRSKRQILGGETERNPNDPVYIQLAQESLQKYLVVTGNQHSYSVGQMKEVTTQVVAGSMTRIYFTAVPNANYVGPVLECFSKIWEFNKKEINVSCVDVNRRSNIQGGEVEQNPNDPLYNQLAMESLQKYLIETGIQQTYSVGRIKEVTTQVVAGSMTRIHFTAVPNANYVGPVLECFSKIRELNRKEIDVSCVDANHRSDIVGGLTEQNPNDPLYIHLAKESLQKYLAESGNQQSYSVGQMKEVTTQIVAGLMTRIYFTAVPNANYVGPALECFSKIWEFNKKEINVSCVHANRRSNILGGEVKQNPNDPLYHQLAKESLQKYLVEARNQQSYSVGRIKEVTIQVVAGSMTRIHFTAVPKRNYNDHVLECFSEIWERPWLNKKDIDVSCMDANQRSKKQMLGGETEQNPNDPVYIELAQESLQKYLVETGNQQPLLVVRIDKVTTQVVSGTMTRINFLAALTTNSNDHVYECFSKIWEQPWLNKTEINVSCVNTNQRSKRQILGGETEQNPNNPIYIQLAQESLKKYRLETGNQHALSVIRIDKVTTQVVSGAMTRINFIAALTTNPNDHVYECFSKIWEQRWLNKTKIDVSCLEVNQRSKRQVVGLETEQNPNDPVYMRLAQESLQNYLVETGNQQSYSVAQIIKVTTEVVVGSMTRIQFLVLPVDNRGDNISKCIAEVWKQPWTNKKKIDVFCEIFNTNGSELIEQDPRDPYYLELADKSLQKYLIETDNKESHKVISVERVTTQFSSGILIRLNFIVVSMNVSNSVILKCFSEVQERSVTETKNIKVSCDNLYKNSEDLKNTTYLLWAEESLQKYLSDTQNTLSYKVVQIEEASSHGFATNIIFVANSTNKDNGSLNCVSFILNTFNEKKINVICETANSELRNKLSPRDDPEYNKYKKYQYHKRNKIEELTVTKPEFQLLASQSLRQYSKKVGILYKLFSVKRVTKSVTSEVVHTIHFTAFPTDCFSNVTNIRALACNVITNSTVNCRATIFGEPNQKRKIQADCVMPEDYLDLLDSMEENLDEMPSKTKIPPNIQESNAHKFAEEALQEYLSFTDAKYVYKITGLYGFYEHLADEKIEFSISPTACLSIKFTGTRSTENCPFKHPRLIYYCLAKRNSGPGGKKKIKVMCKQVQTSSKRSKRQINTELVDDTENEVDEDTMYYYAKAAVSKINEKPQNNNMFKLVSIHAVKSTVQMKAVVVKMYLEVAETYCVRFQHGVTIENCEEMEGLNHKLCLARIYPAPGDDLVIRHVNVVCDDDEMSFNILTGIHVFELLRLSLLELERKPEFHFKLVHQGEPQLIPTLEAKKPLKLNFIIATTNCSKNVDLDKNPYQCYIDTTIPSRSCSSFIWLETATRIIKYINVDCNSEIPRQKRSSPNATSLTPDSAEIKDLVAAALEKLEISSLHRYKQRVLHINSYSSKITTGKVTTIDFDVAYTSCLKYEWVQNVTSCDIIDHLPRRHCVAQIWERLWIYNGRHINVTCEDDETPLEAHIEFESAEMAMQLAQEALKHIEAKYLHPQKQTIVRIFSLEKQIVAGIHYKMKLEVGFTRCPALSIQTNCTLDNERHMNRFCRVNVWVRPWTNHPPNFRVSCDFQESYTLDLYQGVQAEYLFYIFVATYNPSYSNDHVEFERRFEIFKANIKKIHELNVHEKGTATYGVTRFADLTYKEFRARYTGVNTSLRNNSQVSMKKADIPNLNLPANFDWREFDSVTEVKDQGSCGSGWAFSVIGNIEGQWRMQSGELVQLSEQQLLDCDTTDNGCGGGLPEHAYRAVEEMGGLETESNYPYESEGGKCVFNKTMAKVKIHGSVNVTSNETAMAQWLVQNGPISVGINAMAMQFYLGGISHPWKSYCNASSIDHAVLIVGFGVKEYPAYHKKIPYWIVKNSWGKSWGEEGYYRVYRGDGTCGIDRMATSAFIPSM